MTEIKNIILRVLLWPLHVLAGWVINTVGQAIGEAAEDFGDDEGEVQ